MAHGNKRHKTNQTEQGDVNITALQTFFNDEAHDRQQMAKIDYLLDCEDYKRAAHLATIFINGKNKKMSKALSSTPSARLSFKLMPYEQTPSSGSRNTKT
jgi:hypothetical protein